MTLINKRFQFDDRFINADSFVARISICDVGPPFSVTVTGAVHASCGTAQIRSCLQHSTQCMPYKPMHNAFNSTDDRLYKCDCLLQPTRLEISISSTFTGTAQHNQISIDFRTFYDFSSHLNYNYLHIFSDHLLFKSILNVLLIVNFLLIPV